MGKIAKQTMLTVQNYFAGGERFTVGAAEDRQRDLVVQVRIVNRRWKGTPDRHPKGTPLIEAFWR